MSRQHHLVAHLENNEAAALFRGLAGQLDKSGNGVRIFAWRRFAIIFETRTQRNRPPAVHIAVSAKEAD